MEKLEFTAEEIRAIKAEAWQEGFYEYGTYGASFNPYAKGEKSDD